MNDGPTITIARAAELLHCGRTRVFELIRQGQILVAPKFGRKTTVVTESVLRAITLGPKRQGRRRKVAVEAPPVLNPEAYDLKGEAA
jgi:hypothetical protein